jgi:hypothetical protein
MGMKMPAADVFPRGRYEVFDDAIVPVFCPTGQMIVSRRAQVLRRRSGVLIPLDLAA